MVLHPKKLVLAIRFNVFICYLCKLNHYISKQNNEDKLKKKLAADIPLQYIGGNRVGGYVPCLQSSHPRNMAK